MSGDDSDRDDREAGLHDSDDLQRLNWFLLHMSRTGRCWRRFGWGKTWKNIELSWCVSVLLMQYSFWLIRCEGRRKANGDVIRSAACWNRCASHLFGCSHELVAIGSYTPEVNFVMTCCNSTHFLLWLLFHAPRLQGVKVKHGLSLRKT